MKAGWQTKKLGEVCELLNRGISPKYLEEGGVCVLNQKCIREHAVSYDLSRRHDAEVKSVSEERYVQLGDVLVNSTGTGTLGRVAQVREEPVESTTVDSHVTIVRPRTGMFHLDFFGYMLIVIEEAIKEAGEGCGGQTELARSVLAERFSVNYPNSISEQQRIVGILDEAFDGIATAKANAEQNRQNARALFESHLQSVLTQRGEEWGKKPLTAVCDAIFAGGDVPKGNSSKTKTDQYRIPIFTNGEKNKGLYGYTNTARVTEPSITISARGTIGYSEIRKESYYPAIRLIVVIPKKEILDLSFLYYAIESTDIGHSGTSIPQLTVPMVSGFTIPVPPIAVQQTIVGQIDALREETQRLESLYQRKLAALDELKKSLLHQAFSGAL